MYTRLVVTYLIAALCMTSATTYATNGSTKTQAKKTTYQLIVFETKNCFYCDHFRYAVAPVYLQSRHAAKAPLQYVDVRQTDTSRLGLHGPITIAPTTVLTRNGNEIARVAGVTAPADFLTLVDRMLDQAF